jgi:hypothetical protein
MSRMYFSLVFRVRGEAIARNPPRPRALARQSPQRVRGHEQAMNTDCARALTFTLRAHPSETKRLLRVT